MKTPKLVTTDHIAVEILGYGILTGRGQSEAAVSERFEITSLAWSQKKLLNILLDICKYLREAMRIPTKEIDTYKLIELLDPSLPIVDHTDIMAFASQNLLQGIAL